jgi:membrane protein DedA with SNARE-associated domain
VGLLLEIVHNVTAFIASLGYWGIGILMAIESCNIPLASEVTLPFGGYLVSIGRLNFWGAALAGTVGGTVGSLVSYCIGLYGGRPFLDRYGRYLGAPPHRLTLAEAWFARYDLWTVFFTRLLPVIRTFISLPAGVARVNIFIFTLYTFLGTLIWSIFLTYVGFVLGAHWEVVSTYFHRFDLLLLAAFVLLVAWWVWRRWIRQVI